jgi:phosphopantothenate-cysteine ligase
MNILITAGGTSERIDRVRSITNTSTGRLGRLTAEAFSARERVGRIFYVCGRKAETPGSDKAELHVIESVDELADTACALCAGHDIDVVVHAMAVSDYAVRAVSTCGAIAETVRNALTEAGRDGRAGLASGGRAADGRPCSGAGGGGDPVLEALHNVPGYAHDGKIPSNVDDLVIFMRRTPKVLPLLRELLPDALLVGFKLLDGVGEALLIDTAFRLLRDNGCDFVLANDLSLITDEGHTGHLVGRDGRYKTYLSKEDIAEALVCAALGPV